jgi:hypothetical protein
MMIDSAKLYHSLYKNNEDVSIGTQNAGTTGATGSSIITIVIINAQLGVKRETFAHMGSPDGRVKHHRCASQVERHAFEGLDRNVPTRHIHMQ